MGQFGSKELFAKRQIKFILIPGLKNSFAVHGVIREIG